MSRKFSRKWYYNAIDVYKRQKVPLSVRCTKRQIAKCQMRRLNVRLLNIRFTKHQKSVYLRVSIEVHNYVCLSTVHVGPGKLKNFLS